MSAMRLDLIGFGNVGQGMARILYERSTWLEERFGTKLQIVSVSDLNKGSVHDPDGLDPATLLQAAEANERLNDGVDAPHRGWDALETIRRSNAQAVVEISYTDLNTGEPALTHMKAALGAGKHVVTSNKGPIALAFDELSALAARHGVQLAMEGTVMSGTPALHLGRDFLAGAGIRRIQGILNGTTNYVLTQMEAGHSYEGALADAQACGYAEADPAGDVEGVDAAGKVAILGNLLMGLSLRVDDVERTGITGLTLADVREARAANERWKLLGTVERTEAGPRARVGRWSVRRSCLRKGQPRRPSRRRCASARCCRRRRRG